MSFQPRQDFLPFCRPAVSEEDIAAVVAVLRSGWITSGPQVVALEDAIRARTGAPECILFTSGTAAMHLLFLALGIGPGDEVITPSMTWVSTCNLVELCGARSVFVDVDRNTLLASAESIERAITPKTKAIIPVHFAGAPCDMDSIRAIAKQRGIMVIDDAAHAIGTKYKGQEIGAAGTCIFSFHPIKNITTGEGGAITTDDSQLAARLRRLRFHGLAADAFERGQQGRSPQVEVQDPGFKQNLPDMNAALGVSQMRRLDQFIERRAQISTLYRSLLSSVDGIEPLDVPTWNHSHARHIFIVRVLPEITGLTRDEFMAKLKEVNIGTGLHFKSAHMHRWYRENRPVAAGSLENSEWNSNRMCTIPMFPDMTDEDVRGVVAAIRYVLSKTRTCVGAERQ
ncbi:MAG: aminotransferase class I/II-fold pyridoxal phosphate-dependent enzyme [Planctomycetota bacterium]|nr:aminotransferase class I/II-fold pyridoxal phosphate-dependent enzyme [Planctomycetota bacterium]